MLQTKLSLIEDGRVNIGAALRYVKDNVFVGEEDRPDVPNVLFVSTDANSDDDVAAPAKDLRDAGVLVIIFCCFFVKT